MFPIGSPSPCTVPRLSLRICLSHKAQDRPSSVQRWLQTENIWQGVVMPEGADCLVQGPSLCRDLARHFPGGVNGCKYLVRNLVLLASHVSRGTTASRFGHIGASHSRSACGILPLRYRGLQANPLLNKRLSLSVVAPGWLLSWLRSVPWRLLLSELPPA